ncbi:MAG: acyl-CoA desaturase [Actinobacteria bacterium]|nr:acyl-CoA desaturase [Actinomycetota bacterium]
MIVNQIRTATPPTPTTESFATHPPGPLDKTVLGVFVVIPLLAVVIGVPIAFVNGWVSVLDLVMLVVIYTVGVHGITIGYHRLFTHDAFKAGPKMRAFLALAGSLAVEGRVVDWVADHRKHHQFSDADGDPHSPWEYGPGTRGLARGFTHAHVGWLFTYAGTDTRKYAPDLIADRAIDRISKLWPVIAVISMVVPTAIGYAVDGWAGALQAFFWVTLVRVALVHHMTWSINSVCHVWGKRPFATRDRSANVAWLAPISGGESWHNYHHADPTSARHGVLPWQMDTSAVVIRLMERMGLVKDVKWPSAERIERKLAKSATPSVSADS